MEDCKIYKNKMLRLNLLFLALFISVSCDQNNIIVPCDKDDGACMTKSANLALPKILSGIPTIGLESSDPLHVDEIVGDLSSLKYKFTNSTCTGFKNCDMKNVKLDLEKSKLSFAMTCNNVEISGKYIINGRLIILPVEGQGPFTIHCNRYEIAFDGELKQVQGSDGKTHVIVKKYKLDTVPTNGITYDFRNLFNGQKDLADAVLKFANENWKEVADFVQAPVISAVIKKLIANANKFLKTVPIEELVL